MPQILPSGCLGHSCWILFNEISRHCAITILRDCDTPRLKKLHDFAYLRLWTIAMINWIVVADCDCDSPCLLVFALTRDVLRRDSYE